MNDAVPASSSEKPALKDANDNPWYLLATIHDEQISSRLGLLHDKELHKRNRRAWHKWLLKDISEEYREQLKERFPDRSNEFDEASEEEIKEIITAYKNRSNGAEISLPNPGDEISALDVNFKRGCCFEGFVFPTHASFIRSKFQDANFSHAVFERNVYFSEASFQSSAYFDSAVFDYALFEKTIFERSVDFRHSIFRSAITFDAATFNASASFEYASFSQKLWMADVVFKAWVDFRHAYFHRNAPAFFNAQMHEGTFWPKNDTWPVPRRQQDADEFVSHYACLKRHMESQKRQDDELEFYCLELQSRAIAEGGAKGFLIDLYGFFSDYGRSIARPLATFLAVTIIGWLAIARDRAFEPSYSAVNYLGMSLANMFGPLGIRKELVGEKAYEGLHWLTLGFAGLQSIIGVGLLFLIGLALRNRFRMK